MVDGLMQGPSVAMKSDGSRYEGVYAAGKCHGRWLITRPNGTQIEAQYDNGNMLSQRVRHGGHAPHPPPSTTTITTTPATRN